MPCGTKIGAIFYGSIKMSSQRDCYAYWDCAFTKIKLNGAFKTGLICKPISGQDKSIGWLNVLEYWFILSST